VTTNPVEEQFAPAQFFDMTDSEKLSSKKAFEPYTSGVRMDDADLLDVHYGAVRDVRYELFYIDEQRDLVQDQPVKPDVQIFQTWALGGAVAGSPLSQARKGKSALAPGPVQVQNELFAVVNASDLTLARAEASATSQTQAEQLMAQLVRDDPALENEILVVPLFEVNGL
jgi:hypothetical protein